MKREYQKPMAEEFSFELVEFIMSSETTADGYSFETNKPYAGATSMGGKWVESEPWVDDGDTETIVSEETNNVSSYFTDLGN